MVVAMNRSEAQQPGGAGYLFSHLWEAGAVSSQGEEPASWGLRLYLVFREAHQSQTQSEAKVIFFSVLQFYMFFFYFYDNAINFK